MNGANFSEAVLLSTDLENISLVCANMQGIKSRSNVISGNCEGADFSSANLEGSILQGDFSCTKFHEANLTQTDFTDADLQKAQLTSADMLRTILVNANTKGTLFDGTPTTDIIWTAETTPQHQHLQKPTL